GSLRRGGRRSQPPWGGTPRRRRRSAATAAAPERLPQSPPPTRRPPSAWPWWRLPPGPAGPGRSRPDLRAQGADGGPPDLPGGDGQRLPVAAGPDLLTFEDHHRVVVGDDPVDGH